MFKITRNNKYININTYSSCISYRSLLDKSEFVTDLEKNKAIKECKLVTKAAKNQDLLPV